MICQQSEFYGVNPFIVRYVLNLLMYDKIAWSDYWIFAHLQTFFGSRQFNLMIY